MKHGLRILLIGFGTALFSCMAEEQAQKEIIQEKQELASGNTVAAPDRKQENPDSGKMQMAVEPAFSNNSSFYFCGVNIASNIALGVPVTTTVRRGNTLAVSKGLLGMALIGTPRKNFIGGWANSLFFETYGKTGVFGIFTGLNGHVHDTCGLMISLLNRTVNAYGIQIGLLGNVSTGSSGGLSAAFQNKSELCDGVQIGLLNYAGTAKEIRKSKEAEVESPPASGAILAQFGGSNLNNRQQDFSFQTGLFNTARGGAIQIGLLNYAENAWIPWLPLLNFSLIPSEEKTEEEQTGGERKRS